MPADPQTTAIRAYIMIEALDHSGLQRLVARHAGERPLWDRDCAEVLRAAIDTDDPGLIECVLALGAGIDTAVTNDAPRLSAGQYAIQNGKLEAASILLEQGASTGGLAQVLVDKLAQRAVTRASMRQALLPRALNASDRERVVLALLPLAAARCGLRLAEQLCQEGVRVDFRGSDGRTLLHHVVAS